LEETEILGDVEDEVETGGKEERTLIYMAMWRYMKYSQDTTTQSWTSGCGAHIEGYVFGLGRGKTSFNGLANVVFAKRSNISVSQGLGKKFFIICISSHH